MDRLYEVDLHGRTTDGHPGGPCINNPSFRNLLAGEIEDHVRSYDVDGLQRGSERPGPLSNALGAWHHGSTSDPGRVSCFCDYCVAKAKKQGIDTDRVRQGSLALEPYVRNGRGEPARAGRLCPGSVGSCSCGAPELLTRWGSRRAACVKKNGQSIRRR